MKKGSLSDYFNGVAAKRLSAVEVDPASSHQHEFTGISGFKSFLGNSGEKVRFPSRIIYLDDDNDRIISESIEVTWYDARLNHKTRSEFRLYYPDCAVMKSAAIGDLFLICRMADDSLLLAIAPGGSTIEQQLLWLFDIDLSLVNERYVVADHRKFDSQKIGFANRTIIDHLGIVSNDHADSFLESMLSKFKGQFPTTRVFSEYARMTLQEDVSPVEDPDYAIISWMDWEELLFRTLERHHVDVRLKQGIHDVDDFISYSLSIQNRRKSRVGHALEHHLATIFSSNNLKYAHGKHTENRSKPDFLFPGTDAYHDKKFPLKLLTMLGAKSTCKDRWRQVLSEAERIPEKHLFTLEPGISEHQTREMQAQKLQLVVPRQIHGSYTANQSSWLIDLKGFLEIVRNKQE